MTDRDFEAERAEHAAQDATQKLVDLSRAYRGPDKPLSEIPWHELTGDQAAQRLADMEKAYREDNKSGLAAADAAIVGEQQPHEQFETTTWPQVSVRNQLSTIESLRDEGLSDAAIGEAFHPEKHKMSPEVIERLVQHQGERFGDKEWLKKLFDGDAATKREFMLMQIALATAEKQVTK